MSKCCDVEMTYVEVPGVWDGALYLHCETCKRWRHRFPPGDYRRERGHKRDAFPPEAEHHPEDEMHSHSRIKRSRARNEP